MNEDKMIEVLARIEDEREAYDNDSNPNAVGFDMDNWITLEGCGTVACLAGHIYLAEGYTLADFYALTVHSMDHPALVAKKVLGLTDGQARYMFHLPGLGEVYLYVAELMGVDVQVLRDKVTAGRTYEGKGYQS